MPIASKQVSSFLVGKPKKKDSNFIRDRIAIQHTSCRLINQQETPVEKNEPATMMNKRPHHQSKITEKKARECEQGGDGIDIDFVSAHNKLLRHR